MTQQEILTRINSLLNIELLENNYNHTYYKLDKNGNIELLSIRDCKNLDDSNFQKVVFLLKELKTLIILKIKGCGVSDISPILELKSLEVIDIINTQIQDISYLANLTSLRQIHLDSIDTKGVDVIYAQNEQCSFFTSKKAYLRKRVVKRKGKRK